MRQAAAAVATGNQWQLNKCLYLNIKQCIKRFICRCHYKWITPTSANHDDVQCVPLQRRARLRIFCAIQRNAKADSNNRRLEFMAEFLFCLRRCGYYVSNFRTFFSLVLRPNAIRRNARRKVELNGGECEYVTTSACCPECREYILASFASLVRPRYLFIVDAVNWKTFAKWIFTLRRVPWGFFAFFFGRFLHSCLHLLFRRCWLCPLVRWRRFISTIRHCCTTWQTHTHSDSLKHVQKFWFFFLCEWKTAENVHMLKAQAQRNST